EGLLRPLQDPLRAGEGGDVVGLFELVGDDGADGSGQAVADGVVGAEAGPGLGDEDDGDVEAPRPLDQVDGGAGPVGQLGELVHDDQRLTVRGLAGESPVEDVFEEEGADLGGLVAVLRPADGDVGGPGVFVGPAAVEGGADGPGDPVVAGPDAGDVFVGKGPDGFERLGVVPGRPLEGPFVEAADEFAERTRRMVADGVAEDGAGDAFVVGLGKDLGSQEPVDDRLGVAPPPVERLTGPVSGVDAGRPGEGQEGFAGGGVGFAVDPVDVPAGPQGFAGQGEGGDGLAAAGLADDDGLVAPGVERGGDDGASPGRHAPACDVPAEGEAEDGPSVGVGPGGPAGGASGLGAGAAFLAELAVVAGGFVLVAVMQHGRQERRGEDAAGHAEGEQCQQLDGSERVVEP